MNRPIATLVFCVMFASCDIAPNVDVDFDSKDLVNAADKLKLGLEAIDDPLQVERLMNENESFRNTITDLRIRMSSFSQLGGAVILEGQKLKFEVLQYSGTFRVYGWIDKPERWVWDAKRFENRNFQLFDKNAIWTELTTRFYWVDKLAGCTHSVSGYQCPPGVTAGYHGNIAPFFEKYANDMVREYWKNPNVLPTVEERRILLNTAIITGGDHVIYIAVMPVAVDEIGKWSLRGRLIIESVDKSVEPIAEFDVDSDLYPLEEYNLGERLPPKEFLISARSTPAPIVEDDSTN